MYLLSEIAAITGARLNGEDMRVENFLTDSRTLHTAGDTLFVALESGRNDGHRFVPALTSKGVRAFLVKTGTAKDPAASVSFLEVNDPLKALQDLAAHHRSKFSIPVIGITGSNGKTIVKEWLYQLLRNDHTICRSPKSYNSQIGVPLSVLGLRQYHTLAIFEAGISQPGEMENLERIIHPTIGVFTSLGSAHDEGFTDAEQKAKEKFRLFDHAERIIVNGIANELIPSEYRVRSVIASRQGAAAVTYHVSDNVLHIEGKLDLKARLLSADEATVVNTVTCAITLKVLGLETEKIAHELPKLQPVALRLEMKKGVSNSFIINDYYNSDLDSLKIAVSFLKQQNQHPVKCVILSDIEQTGLDASILYRHIASLFTTHGINKIIGVGQHISAFHQLFGADSLFYKDTATLIADIRRVSALIGGTVTLLKGARSFGFEKISSLLQLKSHDTVFEINLNHVIANLNYYRSKLKSGVGVMAMVKATGYGSGSPEVATALQHAGVSYLAVAYADEGAELREAGIGLPIMVMSPEPDSLDEIISNRLEPEIYSFRILDAFLQRLDASGHSDPYPVHIKIDTGMHRLGFTGDEIASLASVLAQKNQLKIASVFTHFAASGDVEHDDFSKAQARSFERACEMIASGTGQDFMRHAANSAAISRFPEWHYSMVRLGIGLYGIGWDEAEDAALQMAGTLRSRISQVKSVKAGESVGYSRRAVLQKDSRIAVIAIGYADGFSRALGNGRHSVLINGKAAPTVGSICMDMCMIDVSDIQCNEGDEVVIFGDASQLRKMSQTMNTIPYETLTSISQRVKRIYVQE